MNIYIRKINSLLLTDYQQPVSYDLAKCDFEYMSYRHWALKELRHYILEHSEKGVIQNVEDFRQQMDDFACLATTGSSNFMFSIAYDVATDCLDEFLTLNGGC